MNEELRDLRRLERLCVQQAGLASLDLARVGLLEVADGCRRAAEAIEAQSSPRGGVIAGVVQALKLSISHAKASAP